MPSDSLYALPLEQQIGQLFYIGLPGTKLDQETRELLTEVKPGGVIIFGRNVAAPEQLRALVDELRSLLPVEPLLGIDQEGGLVDRLRKIFTPMPAARVIREHGDLAAARGLERAADDARAVDHERPRLRDDAPGLDRLGRLQLVRRVEHRLKSSIGVGEHIRLGIDEQHPRLGLGHGLDPVEGRAADLADAERRSGEDQNERLMLAQRLVLRGRVEARVRRRVGGDPGDVGRGRRGRRRDRWRLAPDGHRVTRGVDLELETDVRRRESTRQRE